VVHPADIQDRDGGGLVLATLFGLYPFLSKLFADGGYQGPKFKAAQKKALPFVTTEIVKRSDQEEGFEVIPRRWVVNRRTILPVSAPSSGHPSSLARLRRAVLASCSRRRRLKRVNLSQTIPRQTGV
jgi:transposase